MVVKAPACPVMAAAEDSGPAKAAAGTVAVEKAAVKVVARVAAETAAGGWAMVAEAVMARVAAGSEAVPVASRQRRRVRAAEDAVCVR